MRESFVFYKCYAEVINCFNTPKEKLRLYDAFCKYAFNGEIPNRLKGAEKAVFILFKFIHDKYSILNSKEIRHSPAYYSWRNEVLKRDNFTCQICGEKPKDTSLHAHHIKMFAFYEDERFNVDNGITLCEECHKQIHRREKCQQN